MPDRAPRWLRITVSVIVAIVVGYLFLTDSSGESSDQAATTTSEFVQADNDLVPGPGDVDGGSDADTDGSGGSADTSGRGGSSDAASIGVSGLPASSVDELPDEAVDVLDAIENDEPMPYRQDGSTFQNREGLLPFESEGYYREYTVETPGSRDRGARRIVTGDRGEVFYTADHYDSFVEVIDA